VAYKKTPVAQWKKRFSTASGNQEQMFRRYTHWYDALYSVVSVEAAPWRSQVYLPILARQTWSLVSKFLTLKPGFEVRVLDEEAEEDAQLRAEKAQRKLEYDYNNPDFSESIRDKLFSPLLDAVVCGTGMAKVPWCVEKKERYERQVDEDGTADLTKETVFTKTVGYNELEPVNIFNVFVSPSATDLYKAPWVIIREYKPLAELEARLDFNGKPFYQNLSQVSGSTSADPNNYNRSRNRLLSEQEQNDKTVDMACIYECYENGKICTYAESGDKASDTGWILLSERKNPYWHGKVPLVKFHVKKKPYQFWGEGLFEITYRLQAAYNDAFNHFFDQWNLSENSMLMVPESGNVNDYVVEPGGVVSYRGNQPPTQFKHADPNPNNLSTILTLLDQAVEGVTISQYASGVPNSQADKTQGTATGIMRLQEAAGDVISFFKENFSQSILQIGRMWLSNNQQFMQSPQRIMVSQGGQMMPMTVSPADLQGDMQLIIDEASMQPMTKDQKRLNRLTFNQQLLLLKQAADVQSQTAGTPPLPLNFTEMAQNLAEDFGYQNFNSLLLPAEEAQSNMQQMQATMAQAKQKPPKSPAERFGIKYDSAPPDLKRQMEAEAGFQPSQAGEPLDPEVDAETSSMANELANSGFLDPSVLDFLPPPPNPVSNYTRAPEVTS